MWKTRRVPSSQRRKSTESLDSKDCHCEKRSDEAIQKSLT
jgi:hypothetical protein